MAYTIVLFLIILLLFVFLVRELQQSNKKLAEVDRKSIILSAELDKKSIALMEKLATLNSLLEKDERNKLISTLEDNLLLTMESAKLVDKQKQYKQFFALLMDVLTEDTKFIRSSFFRRFGDVPEFQDLNSQIIAFENKLDSIKITLKEYKMMEDYEE